MHTLIGQPVLVKYYNAGDKDNDHLGTHEVYVTKNRDTGEDMMATDTFAIGTFNDVEIKEVDVDGENKKCLVGYAQLWLDRYYNVCSLLNEWLENDIPIFCSCEYIFKNYEMKDNVQYIKTPYSYTGHTILNSEEKDGYGIVLPAYDEARMTSWNSALREDEMKLSGKCEVEKLENAFLNALNEVSFGETRTKVMDALANVMTANEYNTMWFSDWDIFNDYFIYESYMDGEWKHYKVGYSVDEENNLSVDFENRVEVQFETILVEVPKAEQEKNEAVEELQQTIKTLEEKVENTEAVVSERETELNEVKQENVETKEAMVSMGAKIEELQGVVDSLNEYKEKYETEQYEKALNEAKELYRAKFAKLKAEAKFESEEVQALIVDTLDAEKALSAKSQLADILVDMIEVQPVTVQASAHVEIGQGVGSLNTKKAKKVIRDIDTYVTD